MAKVLELLTKMNDRISALEQKQQSSSSQGESCRTCGGKHKFRFCPNNECFSCHSKGHLSKDCPAGKRQRGSVEVQISPRKPVEAPCVVFSVEEVTACKDISSHGDDGEPWRHVPNGVPEVASMQKRVMLREPYTLLMILPSQRKL
jgi:hypothetical protein